MPNLISKDGVCYPAKERVALTNKSDEVIVYKGKDIEPGEEFIYEGPCRAAVEMIMEHGNGETIGRDFRHDPEWLQSVRNMGFDNPEQYLKAMGYDKDKSEAEFKAKAASIKAHTMPKPKSETLIMGGGEDQSGTSENDLIGGFGQQKVRKPAEVKVVKKRK